MNANLQPRLQGVVMGTPTNDTWLAALMDVALAQLLYSDGTVTRSAIILNDYLEWMAQKGYERGKLDAVMQVMTSDEVADALGVDRSTVFRRAQRQGVGWKVGRDFLFWPDDVRKLA